MDRKKYMGILEERGGGFYGDRDQMGGDYLNYNFG